MDDNIIARFPEYAKKLENAREEEFSFFSNSNSYDFNEEAWIQSIAAMHDPQSCIRKRSIEMLMELGFDENNWDKIFSETEDTIFLTDGYIFNSRFPENQRDWKWYIDWELVEDFQVSEPEWYIENEYIPPKEYLARFSKYCKDRARDLHFGIDEYGDIYYFVDAIIYLTWDYTELYKHGFIKNNVQWLVNQGMKK